MNAYRMPIRENILKKVYESDPYSDLIDSDHSKMLGMLEYLCSAVSVQHENSRMAEEPEGLWQFKNSDLFRDLKKYSKLLQENFSDLGDRLQYLGILKAAIKELKDQLDINTYKYERRICIAIFDAIHKTRAERLDISHCVVLNTCLDILFKGECEQEDFKEVDKALRKSGLNWIIGDD